MVHEGLTGADAPSVGKACASAATAIYAGNHRGMPCILGLSRLNQKHEGLTLLAMMFQDELPAIWTPTVWVSLEGSL